jgi:hypothetical protein
MNDSHSSVFRSLLWATTLAIGFGTIWAALAAWLWAAIDGAQQGANADSRFWEQLVVTSDGTPLVLRTPRDNLSLATYHDLNGRVQQAPDAHRLTTGVYLAGEYGNRGFRATQLGWAQRLRLFVNEQEPLVSWFFVHDGKPAGAGYLVGYEAASNRRVGFLGLSGLRSDPLPPEDWIPVRGTVAADFSQWSSSSLSIYSDMRWARELRFDQWDLPPHRVYVPSGNSLRLVDLAAKTVTTVFDAQAPVESVGIPAVSSNAGGLRSKEIPILVRTTQMIYILNHNHKLIRSFAIPAEEDRRSAVSWYEIDNGQAVVAFLRPQQTRGSVNVAPSMMYRIGDDGKILDRSEAFVQTGTTAVSGRMAGFLHALVLPVPALLVLIESFSRMGAGPPESYGSAFVAMIKDSWPSVLAIFAVSLVLGVMTQRRSRDFGLSRRLQLAWAAFVVLLGLPAFVGFRLSRSWPVRQPCPQCHASAPRDRWACSECGARFPAPARTGIEIFA